MSTEGELVRVGEAAAILGIDPRQVYEAIEAGELPARRLEGHGIRVARADVEAYSAVH
jgi:excisionase family DNA binding protein